MYGDGVERIRELLKRAGLGAVPPAAFAGIATIAVVVLAAGIWRWSACGGESFEVESASQPAVAQEMVPTESAEQTCVIIHVVGAVRHPGIVSIDAGSRVSDALDAAGGLLANAAQEALNLARVVADGEQVAVPTIDEWQAGGLAGGGPAAGGGAGGASGACAAVVNLNTATVTELETLPGVGPSTAAKIVADREANGLFTAPEDLMRVSGIGEKKFEALKDAVVVR